MRNLLILCLLVLPGFTKMSLSESPNARYTVYFFLAEECVICQQYTPLLNELYHEFASTDIEFIGLFPNRFSKAKTIAAFKDKFKIAMPLQTDYFQTKAKALGAVVTPQVFVYDNNTSSILYSGRIDNTYFALGKRRRVTTSFELKTTLQALQSDSPQIPESTEAVGCFIQYHN